MAVCPLYMTTPTPKKSGATPKLNEKRTGKSTPKKRKSSKQRRKEESRIAKERNLRREQYKKLNRMKNLHSAAKFKRILSATDFWFSKGNLKTDPFMRKTLRRHHGWIPIQTLLTFPKFRHWAEDANLLVKAFQSSLGLKKYKVAYSQVLVKFPEKFNEQMLSEDADEGDIWSSSMSPSEENAAVMMHFEALEHDEFGDEDSYGGNYDEYDDAGNDDQDEETAGGVGWMQDTSTYKLQITTSASSFSVVQNQHLKYLEVENDHDAIPEVALVHHRKITLNYLDYLEKELEMEELDEGKLNDKEQRHKEASIKKIKTQKNPSLPKYKTERRVMVVNKPSKVKSFCECLLASVTTFADNCKEPSLARCIGFDAEYCTLEEDIRGNLPAMIQMSSPAPDGPIGLIWIDKFPNHGRDLMKDPNCKALHDIFGDSSLWKVGVQASGDAKNLAEWFGASNTVQIFSGIEDIARKETAYDVRLASLSESVLGKRLPKLKEVNAQKNRQQRKDGKKVPTAHWRRSDLTPIMKEYAAHDAACSVDVWLKMNDLLSS